MLTEPDGEIRYVGKTIKPIHKRYNQHLASARRREKGYIFNWIRSVLSSGYLPTIALIGEVEGNGCKEEIAWIAYGKAERWRLVNRTEGGDGTLGWVPTEENKINMSKAAKTKPPVSKESRIRMGAAHKGQLAWNKGKNHSLETCLKFSEERMGSKNHFFGKHHTDKSKLKMSKAQSGEKHWNYGKHHSEVTKKRMCQNWSGKGLKKLLVLNKGNQYAKGHHHSDTTKNKMKLARQIYWQHRKAKLQNNEAKP